jgi:hypothetical protein
VDALRHNNEFGNDMAANLRLHFNNDHGEKTRRRKGVCRVYESSPGKELPMTHKISTLKGKIDFSSTSCAFCSYLISQRKRGLKQFLFFPS